MSSMLLIVAVVSAVSPYNTTFDRATESFQAGDFAAAAGQYEQLVEEGVVNAAVFYNLGNAYYRLGRLGPAIANYERALQLEPGFEKAAANLAQCVRQSKRHLERPPESSWAYRVLFQQSSMPLGVLRSLTVFFWFATWILLGVRILVPARYLRRAALATAVVAVVLGMSTWGRMHPPMLGVVSRAEAPLRAGMENESVVRATLYEGDRVRVEEREFGWARVRTANGEEGWVEAQALTLVGPPYEKTPEAPAQHTTSETSP